MNELQERNNKINSIYKNKFGLLDEEIKTLGWGSKKSQEKRFKILLQIIGRKKEDSILDVGCGYGDMSVMVDNYTGIDCRIDAIEKAIQKYKNKNFINCNIDNIKNKFDWVVASGIFCFREDWDSYYVENEIQKMFNLSNKGVAFNLLSDFAIDKSDIDMKYVTIAEIIEKINKITNKFSIRHDYLPNDLTVYMYK